MRPEEAARAVVDALEAVRAAINGQGHPNEPHDQDLWQPTGGDFEVYSDSTDCLGCAAARVRAETEQNTAVGDLRRELGLPVRSWEEPA